MTDFFGLDDFEVRYDSTDDYYFEWRQSRKTQSCKQIERTIPLMHRREENRPNGQHIPSATTVAEIRELMVSVSQKISQMKSMASNERHA